MADNDFVILGNIAYDPGQAVAETAKIRRIAQESFGVIKPTADLSGLNKGLVDSKKQFNQLTEASSDFGDSLERGLRRITALGVASAALFGISKAFKESIDASRQLEKSLQSINVVLNLPTDQLDKFGKGLFDVARETTQSVEEVGKSALEFSRQGLSAEETLKRTRAALILTNLAGLDSVKSTEAITAAINSFDKEGLKAIDIVSKLVAVDAKFAVSSSDLAEAITRVGSTAQEVGVDFNKLIAIVAATQQVTQRGGSVIGNALATIFQRIQRKDTLDALEALGIQVREVSAQTGEYTGSLLSADKILGQIGEKFKTLSQEQKAQVSELVAGVRQGNIFRGVLNGLAFSQEAYKTALGATDEAIRRNSALLETQDAKIKQVGTSLQQAGANVGKVGFSDFISKNLKGLTEGTGGNIAANTAGTIIKGLSGTLEGSAGEIGNQFGTILIKSISDIILGPGLVAIGLIGIKISEQLAKFSANTFKQINPFSKQDASIQQQIDALIKNQSSELKNIVSTEEDRAVQEAKILALFRDQTVALAEQKALRTAITPILEKGAPNILEGIKGRNVPNAANGVPDAVHREQIAIAKGVGGASPSAKPVFLPDFKHSAGVGIVANTDEYIVPHLAGSSGPAIFNKEMVAKYGLPANSRRITASIGYIPNKAEGDSFEDVTGLFTPEGSGYANIKDKATQANQLRFMLAARGGRDVFNPSLKQVLQLNKDLVKKLLGESKVLLPVLRGIPKLPSAAEGYIKDGYVPNLAKAAFSKFVKSSTPDLQIKKSKDSSKIIRAAEGYLPALRNLPKAAEGYFQDGYVPNFATAIVSRFAKDGTPIIQTREAGGKFSPLSSTAKQAIDILGPKGVAEIILGEGGQIDDNKLLGLAKSTLQQVSAKGNSLGLIGAKPQTIPNLPIPPPTLAPKGTRANTITLPASSQKFSEISVKNPRSISVTPGQLGPLSEVPTLPPAQQLSARLVSSRPEVIPPITLGQLKAAQSIGNLPTPSIPNINRTTQVSNIQRQQFSSAFTLNRLNTFDTSSLSEEIKTKISKYKTAIEKQTSILNSSSTSEEQRQIASVKLTNNLQKLRTTISENKQQVLSPEPFEAEGRRRETQTQFARADVSGQTQKAFRALGEKFVTTNSSFTNLISASETFSQKFKEGQITQEQYNRVTKGISRSFQNQIKFQQTIGSDEGFQRLSKSKFLPEEDKQQILNLADSKKGDNEAFLKLSSFAKKEDIEISRRAKISELDLQITETQKKLFGGIRSLPAQLERKTLQTPFLNASPETVGKLGKAGFGALFAAPFIAEGLSSAFTSGEKDTITRERQQRGFSTVGQGVSTAGLLLATAPSIPTAIVSSLIAVASVFKGIKESSTDTQEDIAKRFRRESDELSQRQQTIQGARGANFRLQDVLESGGNPTQLLTAQRDALTASRPVENPQIRKLLREQILNRDFSSQKNDEIDKIISEVNFRDNNKLLSSPNNVSNLLTSAKEQLKFQNISAGAAQSLISPKFSVEGLDKTLEEQIVQSYEAEFDQIQNPEKRQKAIKNAESRLKIINSAFAQAPTANFGNDIVSSTASSINKFQDRFSQLPFGIGKVLAPGSAIGSATRDLIPNQALSIRRESVNNIRNVLGDRANSKENQDALKILADLNSTQKEVDEAFNFLKVQVKSEEKALKNLQESQEKAKEAQDQANKVLDKLRYVNDQLTVVQLNRLNSEKNFSISRTQRVGGQEIGLSVSKISGVSDESLDRQRIINTQNELPFQVQEQQATKTSELVEKFISFASKNTTELTSKNFLKSDKGLEDFIAELQKTKNVGEFAQKIGQFDDTKSTSKEFRNDLLQLRSSATIASKQLEVFAETTQASIDVEKERQKVLRDTIALSNRLNIFRQPDSFTKEQQKISDSAVVKPNVSSVVNNQNNNFQTRSAAANENFNRLQARITEANSLGVKVPAEVLALINQESKKQEELNRTALQEQFEKTRPQREVARANESPANQRLQELIDFRKFGRPEGFDPLTRQFRQAVPAGTTPPEENRIDNFGHVVKGGTPDLFFDPYKGTFSKTPPPERRLNGLGRLEESKPLSGKVEDRFQTIEGKVEPKDIIRKLDDNKTISALNDNKLIDALNDSTKEGLSPKIQSILESKNGVSRVGGINFGTNFSSGTQKNIIQNTVLDKKIQDFVSTKSTKTIDINELSRTFRSFAQSFSTPGKEDSTNDKIDDFLKNKKATINGVGIDSQVLTKAARINGKVIGESSDTTDLDRKIKIFLSTITSAGKSSAVGITGGNGEVLTPESATKDVQEIQNRIKENNNTQLKIIEELKGSTDVFSDFSQSLKDFSPNGTLETKGQILLTFDEEAKDLLVNSSVSTDLLANINAKISKIEYQLNKGQVPPPVSIPNA